MNVQQSMDLELTHDELHFYARQILLDEWDIEAQEKLKLSNVLIVGCGGIGCTVAELLARAGVGKITLIDPDHIEISNLQRQIAYRMQDIGAYKAQILVQRLQSINPYIEIISHIEHLSEKNAQQLIAQQDLILDTCDNFKTRHLVNSFAKKNLVPLISASAIGLHGQIFMIDGDSACYECLFPKNITNDQNSNCVNSGVLSTTPNVMASLQAHHALLYLGLNLTPLKQKILFWDGLSFQQKIIRFKPDSYCTTCTSHKL